MVIAHVALLLLIVEVVYWWAFGRCSVVSKFRVKDLARSMIHIPSHCSFVVGSWVIVQVARRGQLYGDYVCARAGAQPWSRGCCDDVPCLSWTVSGHTRLVITYSMFREQAANCSRTSNIHNTPTT